MTVWGDQLTPVEGPPVGTLLPVAVNVIGLPVSVPDEAITVLVPAIAPKVKREAANPLLFVTTEVEVSEPPPPVTAKFTVVPETGLPLASVTSTVNGLGNPCPTVPVWLLPLIDTSFDAGPIPAAPVAVNVIGLPVRVPDEAETVFSPAVDPNVSNEEARPLLPVTTVVAVRDPPPEVTAKLTVTPETGLPLASVTCTVNGLARACPAVPVCPLPPINNSFDAGPVPPPDPEPPEAP